MDAYEGYVEFARELRRIRNANDGKYSPEEGEILDKMTDVWMVLTEEETEKARELFRSGWDSILDEPPHRTLMRFSLKLKDPYHFDFNFFHKVRRWDDGITFFSTNLSFDRYAADHKPSLRWELVLFNYMIEMEIYNKNHLEE